VKIVVIGNGAVGLMTAWEALKRLPSAHVTVIAPRSRPGCASVAAAAMFNSFAEIDSGTLEHPLERSKWLFNHAASPYWKSVIPALEAEASSKIAHGFGTFLVNNHVSDSLEDVNFEAVLRALKEFEEPHEMVNPRDIPHYNPASSSRAARCVYIPGEGFANPIHLLAALERALERTGRATFIDSACAKLETKAGGTVSAAVDAGGEKHEGDVFLLAPGANFSKIIKASNLGIKFPRIFYGAGCTVVLKTGTNTVSSCIRTPNRGLACGLYSAPRDAEHTVVGASNYISPDPVAEAFVGSVYTLLKGAMEQINANYYKAQLTTVNMGWRPTSEDTLPMVGATAISNLYVATATKRDGLHCSPLIARCIVDLMCAQPVSHDLSSFRPDREPVKVLTRAEAVDVFVRHSMNANYQHDFVPAKNKMVEQLEAMYRRDIEDLHDKVGANDWGIPPELVDMYRYGHISGGISS
jgi:glycine oxidase